MYVWIKPNLTPWPESVRELYRPQKLALTSPRTQATEFVLFVQGATWSA
jgi:hypothetical protein